MTELDLDHGDLTAAEEIQAAGRTAAEARRARNAGKAAPKKPARKTASAAAKDAEEKSLQARLVTMFEDLSQQFEARQDEELSELLTRRKESMSQGLVSLTRSIGILRHPLVLFLVFLEPTLAFWELGGLVARRYVERRQRIAWERANQNGQVDVTDVTGNQGPQMEYTG